MSPYICPESPPTTSCGDYSSTDENAYDGSRNSDVNHDPSGVNQIEPIAVIGLSLEFPQEATSTEAFWQMLIEARSGRTGIPKDRFNLEAFHHPDAGRQDNFNIREGHFLKKDLGSFDAPFFSITPAEAASLDPQQRGLLETAYRAFENAGIRLEDAAGSKTSVHVGSFAHDWQDLIKKDSLWHGSYEATGSESTFLANRVSWFFDLAGPSISLDTACSSSLMALHLACQSLRSRESSMGLVGGANVFFNPDNMTSMANLGMLSPDGICYSFDHRANGYARGEGYGFLVIKRLSDALKDGDTIRAIIRATGSNQDGKTPGITQPNGDAQERLIRDTYRSAGLERKLTRYFEAHGTGTPTGDPIEARAIAMAFDGERSEDDPLYIGSVKTNIGHLEGASGIASLIKTLLVLEKGVIPPNVWFEKANPRISESDWNIKFPRVRTKWPGSGLRRASVNSFGLGGSNVHVVLDDVLNHLKSQGLDGNHLTVDFSRCTRDALELRQPSKAHSYLENGSGHALQSKVYVWSAADEDGLRRLTRAYALHLSSLSANQESNVYLENLSYTLFAKRSLLRWRSYVVANSRPELRQALEKGAVRSFRSTNSRKLAFIFTGQGAQWHAMGRELMHLPVYKMSLRESQSALSDMGCKWSLSDELAKAEDFTKIHDPEYSQPICTALQMALIDLLESCGQSPSAVLGHSSGEIAAAYCAGALSKWSALKIAFYRGRLSAKLARSQRQGAMMSVDLSETAVKRYVSTSIDQSEYVSIACINSPKNVTLSGSERQISTLKSVFERDGVAAKVLRVNVAYHSKAMSEIAVEYGDLISDIATGDHKQDRPVIVSSLTGTEASPDEMSTGTYWVRNLTSPVRFSEALTNLCLLRKLAANGHGHAITDILEIGPHSTLKWLIKDTLAPLEYGKTINYDSLLTRGASALTSSFSAIGRLHCLGYAINLSALNNPIQGKEKPQVLAELPEYPFNHSQTYWFESRLSKNSRFRTHARHELLGTRVPDWNPKEARWRHMIRQSENPWIIDHKVNGIELYPAGGLLVMAIEAARQMSSASKSLSGYRLTDVYFLKPLMSMSKAEGFETQISLRHLPYEDNKAYESKYFAIYTHEDGDWTENCRGTITLEYFGAGIDFNPAKESDWELEQTQQTFNLGTDRCNKAIDSVQLYRRLEGIGLSYGPKFRALQDIRHGDDEAIATVKLCQWATDIKQGHYQEYIIHPTALDGLIQLSLPALFERSGKTLTTMVPKYVRSVWVTSQCLSTSQEATVKAHAQHIRGIPQGSECSILALDNVTEKPQVVIKGLQTAKLGIHTEGSQVGRKRICYGFDWKPDVDLLSKQGFLQYCSTPLVEPPDEFIEDLEFMCFSFLSSTLDALAGRDTSNFKPHFHRYIGWMQQQSERYNRGELIHWRPDWPTLRHDTHHTDKVISRVETFSAEGELYAKIGKSLLGIIEGKVDALELLFTGDLATRFYQEANGTYQGLQTIKPFLDALAHKTPGLKILEIGAGTGSSTGFLLDTFALPENAAFGALRYEKYTFTDISSGFFEKAKQRFKDHADRMAYATLDIEQDPLQQGFQEGEYDLVLAANVLHATSNVENTLQNTRKLLKPGGKLILSEVFNDAVIRVGFAFGLLPGWWLGTEKSRQEGPLLPEAGWNTALRASGFSGTDLVFQDWENPRNHMTNTMISTAISRAQTSETIPEVVIVSQEESALQSAVAHQVRAHLASNGVSCNSQNFSTVTPSDLGKRFCIFLPEMETSLLPDPSEADYARIKNLFHWSAGLLWLTQGGGHAPTRPETGMIVGLSRCVRSEDGEKIVVTLALENASDVPAIAQYIVKILEDKFRTWPENDENEYQEHDGKLCINRLVEGIDLNDHIFSKTSPQEARKEKLDHEQRALALEIASPGLLNTLQYVEDPEFGKPLADDEIEVKVQAVGLNLNDALTALGRLPESDIGSECAGVVTHAGSNANFVPEDRVCVLALGTFKTHVRTKATTAGKIPNAMNFCEAAGFPLASVTALHALCEIANLSEGESVLIHSGADTTGQVAIQLSQHLKAEIFVTVSSDEEKRLIIAQYSIQEDHIFSSQGLLFSTSIQRITNNRGVNVVLNTLADEGRRRSWDCLASFGSFIDIGKNNSKLPMLASKENCRYAAVNVLHMVSERPRLIKKTMEAVMALLEDKRISTPQPSQIYDNSRLEEAFRSLQSEESMGKSVVEFNKDDVVAVVPSSQPRYDFQGDKTYVISGGLGGLGRQVVRWMAGRGARHLILLSRSEASSKEARELLDEMQKMGVAMVAAPCDVSDESALASVLADSAQNLPPIKGCIQASMVLEDSLFESMPLNAFTAATKPKVRGSWNLHKILPEGLDFFVLLSSASGVVGFRAQANYAAGNTYQDSLARYRTSHGEKAVSLNLGTIASSGYVAERPGIMEAMIKMGYPPIDEAELLALLEFYCDPGLELLDPSRCQVVTGLNTPAKMRQMGLEEAYWMHDNRFRALWQMDKISHAVSPDAAEKTADYKTLLASTESAAEAAAIVSQALLKKLAETLSMPLEDIDAGQPMHVFGVDSLVAVEIRNWLGRELGAQLSVFEILGKDSIAGLSAGVAKKCVMVEEGADAM